MYLRSIGMGAAADPPAVVPSGGDRLVNAAGWLRWLGLGVGAYFLVVAFRGRRF